MDTCCAGCWSSCERDEWLVIIIWRTLGNGLLFRFWEHKVNEILVLNLINSSHPLHHFIVERLPGPATLFGILNKCQILRIQFHPEHNSNRPLIYFSLAVLNVDPAVSMYNSCCACHPPTQPRNVRISISVNESIVTDSSKIKVKEMPNSISDQIINY